jgi:hypothetical protein
MADIKIVSTEPEKDESIGTASTIESPVSEQLIQNALAEVSGVENEVHKYSSELKNLLEWAKQNTDDHSIEGLRWAIRQLDMRLGSTQIGEKRIHLLNRFAYLEMQGKKIKKELEKISRI